MTTITLRIDADLKQDLQNMAKSLGLSLNQLINLKMREFRENKTLNLSLSDDFEVEDFTEKEITNLEKYGNFSKLTKNLDNLIIKKWM